MGIYTGGGSWQEDKTFQHLFLWEKHAEETKPKHINNTYCTTYFIQVQIQQRKTQCFPVFLSDIENLKKNNMSDHFVTSTASYMLIK